jgi:PAS domain-containing protein
MDSSRFPRTGTPARPEGRIVQWYGLSVDTDEGKKAEDRLRHSEAYLAEAQRLSHTWSAAYNETEILYWSEGASRIWGVDQLQDVPSREAVWQRIHPDDLERVNENIQHGVREKRRFANEFRRNGQASAHLLRNARYGYLRWESRSEGAWARRLSTLTSRR